jgi:hypothetical protein
VNPELQRIIQAATDRFRAELIETIKGWCEMTGNREGPHNLVVQVDFDVEKVD